jgi:hypothetical protein
MLIFLSKFLGLEFLLSLDTLFDCLAYFASFFSVIFCDTSFSVRIFWLIRISASRLILRESVGVLFFSVVDSFIASNYDLSIGHWESLRIGLGFSVFSIIYETLMILDPGEAETKLVLFWRILAKLELLCLQNWELEYNTDWLGSSKLLLGSTFFTAWEIPEDDYTDFDLFW